MRGDAAGRATFQSAPHPSPLPCVQGRGDKILLARRALAVLLPLALLGGCDKPKGIAVYDVPKESAAAASSGMESSALSGGVDGARWMLPAGWTAQPGENGRLATLHPGAGAGEIRVSKFGAMTNAPGLNVSRWHGDVGLEPVDDAHADAGQTVVLGSRSWTIHDYTGPKNGGSRVIIASTDVAGETWFFKFLGPADAVGANKADFDHFLASIKLEPQAQ